MMSIPTGQYGVWIGAFGDTGPPIDTRLVLSIFESMSTAFELRLERTRGNDIDTLKECRVESPRSWLEQQYARMVAKTKDTAADEGVIGSVAAWVASSDRLDWYIEACPDTQYRDDGRHRHDPCLFIGIDLGLARGNAHIRTFITESARLLLADERICYAFVNPAPRHHVPSPSFYSICKYADLSWERLVEQDTWLFHRRGPRDRVRGLFWGNIFGPAFARRLRDAGFLERIQWLRETHPWGPVLVENKDTGSMAVFLDDDPIAFARKRDDGLNSDSAAVRSGGVLWTALSRAGML